MVDKVFIIRCRGWVNGGRGAGVDRGWGGRSKTLAGPLGGGNSSVADSGNFYVAVRLIDTLYCT